MSSKEDMSSILYEGRAKLSEIEDIFPMIKDIKNDDWRCRLAEAIKKSGKSERAVSLAAGKGPGYVHSILKEGKDPTLDNLIAICGIVGVSLPYIVYGYNISSEAEEILSLIEKSPQARDGILKILKSSQSL